MIAISQRRYLTDSEIWIILGRLDVAQTHAKLVEGTGVAQSVISRIWNRFLETGSASRRPVQDRRRATMANEDRYLRLTARRHLNMNAGTPSKGCWHHNFDSICPKPAPRCRTVFIFYT
ncbi:hypothetical protein NPIL_296591 [Nephila pilipes]|uniref:Uncharacterized protein n=1 Tax=Nephila pilipes TaxID=299642 RepID=A0A8X6QJ86_NEPPI|nr:hypothetical protein NPIL_296591 [Nephila pilipes]